MLFAYDETALQTTPQFHLSSALPELARPPGKFRRFAIALIVLVPALYHAPYLTLFFLLPSPINLFADMLSARNDGTYRLEDLPKTHREEIEACVKAFVDDADQARYCLFMDIVRPNHLQPAFDAGVSVAALVASSFTTIFYKNWPFIR